jgi:hypothetical protein
MALRYQGLKRQSQNSAHPPQYVVLIGIEIEKNDNTNMFDPDSERDKSPANIHL